MATQLDNKLKANMLTDKQAIQQLEAAHNANFKVALFISRIFAPWHCWKPMKKFNAFYPKNCPHGGTPGYKIESLMFHVCMDCGQEKIASTLLYTA